MTPKREAQIWRMVRRKLRAQLPSAREGEHTFLCWKLAALHEKERKITWAERNHLECKLEELLEHYSGLEVWLSQKGIAGMAEQQVRDPGLVRTRLAWVDWLIAQAEARHG